MRGTDQVVACDGEDYHAVAIEGATPLMPLSWLLSSGWMEISPESGKGQNQSVGAVAGRQGD